jgi:phospholipase/carboxylesterase
MIGRRAFLAGVAATLAVGPGHAREVLGPGEHALGLGTDRDGLLYLPRAYRPDVAMPLVVLLHGAGGNALSARTRFALADELGFVILAPDSRDERTWDELLGAFGPDQDFISAALRWTFMNCAIDRSHVALAGVSDGASYALSLGVGNGDTFSHLIAFSPAFVLPLQVRGKPRIFISHGTKDQVMPVETTGREVVRRLKALSYDVTYREFDGGHTVPDSVAREAFEWFRH